MQAKVLFARFPGNDSEHPDASDWYTETILKAKSDPRISEVLKFRKSDTPIPMVRNLCIEEAKKSGADFVVMIDSDMTPDLPGPGQKKFWDVAWPFAFDAKERLKYGIDYHGPCVIGAPYCGRPPIENVFIFKWMQMQTGHPNPDFTLGQYNREEAACHIGIEEVAALPTGLIIIDMRVFEYLEPPYFYYEYKDETESVKVSTEDVTFTRDASMAGCCCFVAWDCWAGHNKPKLVLKPGMVYVDDIREQFRKAIARGIRSDMKLTSQKREDYGASDPRNFSESGGRLSDRRTPYDSAPRCAQSIPCGVEGGEEVAQGVG